MRDYLIARVGLRSITSFALLALCLAPAGQAQQRHSLRGIGFSAPKFFSSELRVLGTEAGFFKHTRFALGVFVAVLKEPYDERARMVEIGTQMSKELFPTENPRYRWKWIEAADRKDRPWLTGNVAQGFNGHQRVLITYRRVVSSENEAFVGYVANLGRGSDEEAQFHKNMVGFSIPGDAALEELVASVAHSAEHAPEAWKEFVSRDGGFSVRAAGRLRAKLSPISGQQLLPLRWMAMRCHPV